MSNNGWNLEAAINSFYNSGGGSSSNSSSSNSSNTSSADPFSAAFDACKKKGIEEGADADVDAIQGSGLIEFAKRLSVDPENDPYLLILSWVLQCENKYIISREELMDGMDDLDISSFKELKNNPQKIRSQIKSPTKFREFYKWVFDYIRDQRSISVEIAVAMWRMLLPSKFKYLTEWCNFVEKNQKNSISKDTWNQFLLFVTSEGDKSSFPDEYDEENGAWPVLIDLFVEHIRSLKKIKS
mgnify:CR=1 FL=1